MGRFYEDSTVDPKKNCAGHIEYRRYAIETINSVGVNAIRVYATTKPQPVKDFEKFFEEITSDTLSEVIAVAMDMNA